MNVLTPEKFAYRTSVPLSEALDGLRARCEAFITEVVHPWEHQQTEVASRWRMLISGDMECDGFALKNEDGAVPSGLRWGHGGQAGGLLIPRAAKTGDPWRAVLENFEAYPKLSEVLRSFGVEPVIMAFELGRGFRPGVLRGPDGRWFLTWGHEHPEPGPHLELVALSVFYAAAEEVNAFEPASPTPEGSSS
jgi:hypothetical protein